MGSLHSRLIVTPQLSRRGQVINIPRPIMPAIVHTPQAAAHAGGAASLQVAATPQAAPAGCRQAAAPAAGAAAMQAGAPIGARLLVQQHCNSPAVVVNRPRLPPKREIKKNGPTYITPDVAPTDLEAIRNLRGIGAKRLLVILGNGPSLSEIDPVPLTIEPNIDLMAINKPDGRVWPTRYWAFFDQSQLFRHRDLWSVYNGYIFNSTSIQQRRPGSIQFKNLHDLGFSLDLTSGLNIGRSSVYAAMQIGLWMGFEHIYILGCLPDGEQISTARGLIPIDELADDDLVYTTAGFKPFQKRSRRWYDGELVSITSYMNDSSLTVTTEHPVLVERDGCQSFVSAGDLRQDDWLVYPIDRTEVDIPVLNDRGDQAANLWWLVGLYAAAGYIRTVSGKYEYATLCLDRHDLELADKVFSVVAELFNCKVTRDDGPGRTDVELIVNSHQFGSLVTELVGRGATAKRLTKAVLELPLHHQLQFLAGCLASDGSVFKHRGRGICKCTFSTASESLADGIQKMLLRLGVISSLTRSFPLKPDGRLGVGFGVRYHVCIASGQLEQLARLLDVAVHTDARATHFSRIDGDRLLVRVRRLERIRFEGYVNNIEVAEAHTYGAHLIMTHNCDMREVDGKLHFYGRNPDVEPDIRKTRFDAEANYYEHAATLLPEAVRRRFTFCSSYNPYPFVERYGRLDHRIAVAEIISKAHELAARASQPEAA